MKKFLVPHKDNNHLPHLFKEGGIVVVLIITLFLFGSSQILKMAINSERMLANVYPAIVVALTNQYRGVSTLPPLRVSPLLEEAARLKANDMFNEGYFAHNSPTGKTPWYWIKQVGYSYSNAGENLAINYSDSADVTTAWMNSPTHRANILNNKFTEVGVATVKGNYEGREVILVVEMFGNPKAFVAAPSDTRVAVIATTTTAAVATGTPTTTQAVVTKISSSTVLGLATDVDSSPSTSSQVVLSKEAANSFLTFIQPNKMLRISYVVLLIVILLSFIAFIPYSRKHHISHIYNAVFIIVWVMICVLLVYSFSIDPLIV